MDAVEVYNCSQKDQTKAAVRIERAIKKQHRISNCAIHSGLAVGIFVDMANVVEIRDNIVYAHKTIGIRLDSVTSTSVHNNVVMHIQNRWWMGNTVEPWGGITVCSIGGNICPNVTVTSNIVAGAQYTGFTARGHNCGDYSTKQFKHNVAHSIATLSHEGYAAGYGAIVTPDLSSSKQMSECMESSFFAAYKTVKQGINGGYL